jgi:hypothetical protein
MTPPQKTGTALAGVIAVLTLLLASQSLPVLQFIFGELRTFANLPLFGPVVVAALVGAVAPSWLPHLVPSSWERHTTKRVTRLLGSSIAFLMVFWRYPNAIGAQYGLFAGTMAYVLYTMGSSLFYRHFPQAEPESMKTDDGS